MDNFSQGMMLGRVLELSEQTASKVDRIEARQTNLIRRIEQIESAPSPRTSTPAKSAALAAAAALAGGFANLKAEQIAQLVSGLIRGLGSP